MNSVPLCFKSECRDESNGRCVRQMPSGIQKLLRLFVCLASSIAGLVVGGFLGLALGLRITGAGGLHGIDSGATQPAELNARVKAQTERGVIQFGVLCFLVGGSICTLVPIFQRRGTQ